MSNNLSTYSFNPDISDLKNLINDKNYLAEDRDKVKNILDSQVDKDINELLEDLRLGNLLDLFSDLMSSKNITNKQLKEARKIFKKINDKDLILEEIGKKELIRFFSIFSDVNGQKIYNIIYFNLSLIDMPFYIDYELADSDKERDELIISFINNDVIHSGVMNLFMNHLKERPIFLAVLFNDKRISDKDLIDIVKAVYDESGESSLSYKVISYLLFNSKRIKNIKKFISKKGLINPNEVLSKKIKKIDKEFFSKLRFK